MFAKALGPWRRTKSSKRRLVFWKKFIYIYFTFWHSFQLKLYCVVLFNEMICFVVFFIIVLVCTKCKLFNHMVTVVGCNYGFSLIDLKLGNHRWVTELHSFKSRDKNLWLFVHCNPFVIIVHYWMRLESW